MKFGTAIIILLLSVIALVAEVIIYFIIGLGMAFSQQQHGTDTAMQGWALVCAWVFFMTIAAGVGAPICAFIEMLAKKENLGAWLMMGGMIVCGVLLAIILAVGHATTIETAQLQEQQKQADIKKDHETFLTLKPDEQRERLRSSYLTVAREENPSFDGITTELAKNKGGFDLWARHPLFSQYTLTMTTGRGNKISAWVGEHREELKAANIKRVGVKGTGAYASYSFYEP